MAFIKKILIKNTNFLNTDFVIYNQSKLYFKNFKLNYLNKLDK